MRDKLSLTTKLGFGIGDFYGGGALLMLSFYYLFFLTDVVGLAPSLAGLIIMISKIWDAVSDPLMGTISDRTRSRFGRRRPYFLAGIPLIFLSFMLLWAPFPADSQVFLFGMVLLSYLFFSTVVTMVMVPYNALSAELTLDYDERTSVSTYRIFFSSVASLVCALIPLEIVKAFPQSQVKIGYFVMGIAFGVFFALPFVATFFSTKERQEFQKEPEPFDFRKTFLEPFRTPGFSRVLSMYLFAFLAIDAVSMIVIYYMTYYLGRGDETNYVLGVLLLMQIICLPFFAELSRRTSKRRGYLIAIAIWVVVQLSSILIVPGAPWIFVYIFAALVGLGTGGVVIMIYSIFPDVPDIDEFYSGKRREGVYSGLYTFMRKFSAAVVTFILGIIIEAAGYVAPVEEMVDGALIKVQQVQTAEFILVLRAVFVAIPLVLLGFGVYHAFRYPLSPKLHARLKDFLAARREGATDQREEAFIDAALHGDLGEGDERLGDSR